MTGKTRLMKFEEIFFTPNPRPSEVNSDVTSRHSKPIKSRFYPHKFGQLTASPPHALKTPHGEISARAGPRYGARAG